MPTVIDGQLGVSKIQDNTVTSPKIVSNSVNYDDLVAEITARLGSAGSISGDRNRVINGSCQIVNVATVAVPSANGVQLYGGTEMFLAQNRLAGGQFTQSQGSLSFGGLTLPTVRQTVNTAVTNIGTGNYWFGITQFIEGFNVFDLRGKPVILSFVFNTNVSGTYSVALTDGAAGITGNGQSYVATFAAVANTPMQVTIPVAAIPSAASIPNTNGVGLQLSVGFLNTGTFQTATLNAWQANNFRSASGATNWGATAGNFIELTNLQLEEGTVATPFIRRSYQQELALTQRYYEFLSHGWNDTRNTVGTENAFPFNNSFSFAVEKRATPSMSFSLNQTSFSALTFNQITTRGFNFGVQTQATGAGANSYVYVNNFTAIARL